jgi:streptogramin lyase
MFSKTIFLKNKKIKKIFVLLFFLIVFSFFSTQKSFAFTILNFGTTGASPIQVVADSLGNIYVANSGENSVSKITPGGVSSLFGDPVPNPWGITADINDNIYAASSGNHSVSKITPGGVTTIFAPVLSSPRGVVVDSSGNIYTANDGSDDVAKITPGGVISSFASVVGSVPRGLAIDSSDNLYTANWGSDNVTKITPLGVASDFGTVGTNPLGIAVDSGGNVYTANYGSNNVSKITPLGVSTIFGATGINPYSITVDSMGNVYTANFSSNNVTKISPLGVVTDLGFVGLNPTGITTDSDDNVYVTNNSSQLVAKITVPTVMEASPVLTPALPGDPLNYTFYSNSAGTITYGGSCSSATTVAIVGDNTITFDPLLSNTYNDCTITVTDDFGISNLLPVSSFTVLPIIPTVTTDIATSITKNSALLNGTISSTGGENPTTRFEYGTTTAYGTATSESVPLGVESFAVEISGLRCRTTYHFKAFATNSGGVADGGDQTFTTARCSGTTGGGGGGGNPPPPPIPTCEELGTCPVPTCEELGNCPPAPEPTCEELGTCPTPPTPTCEELGTCPVPTCEELGNCPPVPEPTCEELGNCEVPPEEPTGIEFEETENSFFENTYSGVQDFLKDNFTSEQKEKINTGLKIASVGSVVVAGAVSLGSILFLNPFSTPELVLIPFRLWSLLLTALGLKKRIKPWGTVYDSVTKQPLDPVYVSLINLEGKEVASSITDIDGRYGFYVDPGVYKVLPRKTNYIFPSSALAEHLQDELYQDLYFGDYINVAEGQIITNNIPMDPINFDWNEFAKNKKQLFKFYSKKELLFSRISNILFGIGFGVATLALIVSPEKYNIIIFGLYILVFILRRIKFKFKVKGRVFDKNGLPLSYGVIRVFSISSNVELIHKVVDRMGRYHILLPNGNYYVKIEKKNDDGSYSVVYTSESIEVTRGVLNRIFNL